jgi:hypothetical protein
MSDLAGGIGGAIEGALTGRAVEPNHGEAAAGDHEVQPCANCGAVGASTFCPECGQKRHVHRTLSAIGHDLIHGVLHLDGKFWNTLPLLAFKPGQLTRRYINGERAKFVSPMAMFLFTVFAMFAVFQMIGLSVPSELPTKASAQQVTRPLVEERERLTQKLAGMAADDPARAAIEREIRDFEQVSDGLSIADQLGSGQGLDVDVNITGIESIDKGIIAKWRKNPGLMFYKLQANAYKFSWLLIPLSIPFVWLTFAWRRRFKAYDHAVFVTYSLSFMSMLFIVASLFLISTSLSWVGVILLLGVPPVHLYKQLRGAYELRRLSALWRLLAISVFIWIVIILFLQALLLLGAF